MLRLFVYLFLKIRKARLIVRQKLKEISIRKYIVHDKINIDIESSTQRLIDMRQPLAYKSCYEGQNEKRLYDVSIIIPVFNAENYIKQCIDSVIENEIKYSFEVICVDDGSTDNSLKIINEYSYDEHFVIVSQKNQGASEARNHGLSIARGKYILFVDADDFVPRGAINEMIDAIIANDADIVLGMVGKYIEKLNISVYPCKKKPVIVNNYLTAVDYMPGTPWGKLYKADLWDDIRFFSGYAYEDTAIFMNVYPKAKKFVLLGLPVYRFRSGSNSLFKRSNKSNVAIDSLWIVMECTKKAQEQGIDIYSGEYLQIVLWHLSSIMYERIQEVNSSQVLKDAFSVAVGFVESTYAHGEYLFSGNNSAIFQKIYESYCTHNYQLWKLCCEALTGYKMKGEL